MNILIIAGEVSGEGYAANLVPCLRELNPDARFWGIGGDKLRSEVDEFVFESAYSHGVGLETGIMRFRFKAKLLSALTRVLEHTPFDKAILIDFQHYNLAIAACLQTKNIPIHTFITPNFWMWKSRREAKKICAYSQSIISIFKPEHALYTNLHPNAQYFGHPLTDTMSAVSPSAFPKKPQITLLPGSRPQEFQLYLKKMLQTLTYLQHDFPNLSVSLPLSAAHYRPVIESYLAHYPQLNIRIESLPSSSIIAKSSLVLAASGSVTLEAILLRRPLIVYAALPPLTYFLAKYLLRLNLPYISLPNFLTNKAIVPEFVQSNIQPANIAQTATKLIQQPEAAIQGYDEVIQCLSSENPVYKSIADFIMKK